MPSSVLQMPFTDNSGCAHPSAIWIPGTVIMDNVDMAGGVDWLAYHSPQAYAAGDSPVQGGQHHTALGRALYAGVSAFPIPAGATTYGQVTMAALVYLAQNVLDTPAPPNADGSTATNPDGSPEMRSFFVSATIITLP